MESRVEKAVEKFKSGCNCSQAVLLAYADLIGLDENTAMLIASGLGGGVGRMREICGAVNAAAIVAGMKVGSLDPNDRQAKKHTYETVQKVAEEFKKTNRSIICRELLGLNKEAEKNETAAPSERTREYYKKRPCADIVADAAKALEAVIFNEE